MQGMGVVYSMGGDKVLFGSIEDPRVFIKLKVNEINTKYNILGRPSFWKKSFVILCGAIRMMERIVEKMVEESNG